MVASAPEITRLLKAAHRGDPQALDEVARLVYDDLRRMAARHLRGRYGPNLAGATLQPSALVNETFLRLIKQRKEFDSRGHFFAISTRLMLRVLTDHERAKSRRKRAGDQVRVSLGEVGDTLAGGTPPDIPAFVDALDRLDRLSGRTAEVSKLKLVWGLTMPEIAGTLGVSVSTVESEWRFARKWLATELSDGSPEASA